VGAIFMRWMVAVDVAHFLWFFKTLANYLVSHKYHGSENSSLLGHDALLTGLTWHHTIEELNIHQHHWECLKSGNWQHNVTWYY